MDTDRVHVFHVADGDAVAGQKYLGKQQEAVEREMAELGRIKSSLDFLTRESVT
ncbi:hypothetical protein ACXO2Q_08000 [Lactobacillus delbrueckii subsp. bulgaricus]